MTPTISTTIQSTSSTATELEEGFAPVSSSVYQMLYSVAQTSYDTTNSSYLSQVKPYNGSAYTESGKPILVYIGGEYCPYCAFQRWGVIIALMRFGNFSNLHYMQSSPIDIFPNTPTFTFYNSTYTSKYLVFQGYEQVDRSMNPLQTVPVNYSAVFRQFGAAYPFLDFGNRYIVVGSFYTSTVLDGKTWTQIAQLLGGNNTLSGEVIGSANAITAIICKLTNGNPSSVCSQTQVASLTGSLTAYYPSAGAQGSVLITWANMQYGKMMWMTKERG